MIYSPLTDEKSIQIESISTQHLIQLYKMLQVDVEPYFRGKSHLSLYECPTTHLKFFAPDDLAGDGAFYAQLQHHDWYYMPWKWEHNKAFELIQKSGGNKILELGSGGGDFVEYLTNNGFEATGLELNPKSVEKAQKEGYHVEAESIQNWAQNHQEDYDWVVSFQVMEHVTDLKSVLDASIACLKPEGKLLICVPDNDSFIKYAQSENALNHPPHHMILWDENSLRALTKLFPVELENRVFEPLQAYHEDWFYDTMKKEWAKKNKLLGSLAYRLGKEKFLSLAHLLGMAKRGHSIMTVYKKNR